VESNLARKDNPCLRSYVVATAEEVQTVVCR
jgi:hypothetical protein